MNKNKLTLGLVIVSLLSVGFAIYTSFSHKQKPSTNDVVVVADEPKIVIPEQPVVADLPNIPDYVPAPIQSSAVVNNSPIEPPVVANILDDSVNNSLVSVPVVEPKKEEPVVQPQSAPVTQLVSAPATRKVLQYQTVRMCGQNGCTTQQVPVWVDVPVAQPSIPVRTNTYAVPTQPSYNYNQGSGGRFPILGRIFGGR